MNWVFVKKEECEGHTRVLKPMIIKNNYMSCFNKNATVNAVWSKHKPLPSLPVYKKLPMLQKKIFAFSK